MADLRGRARGPLPPPPPSRIQVVQDDAGLTSLTKGPRGGGLHPPHPRLITLIATTRRVHFLGFAPSRSAFA